MVNTIGHTNGETYTGRKLRQLDSPFLAGATSARPLGSRSGVRPGTPATTVTATSTTWTCQPFAGIIDFVAAAEAGAYPFAFDAAQTGSVNAAQSLSRVDILYVEGNDPAESAGTPVGVSVKYLAGAADGSGNPPSTPARSFRIARINVPATGGGSPTVVFDAPFMSAAGGVQLLRNSTEETAALTQEGQVGYRLDTQQGRAYMGPTIGTIQIFGKPDVVALTPNAAGGISAGSPAPQALAQNGRVYTEGMFTSASVAYTAGTIYGVGAAGAVPAAYRPSTAKRFACTLNGTAVAEVLFNTDGSINMTSNTSFSGALLLSLAGCNWTLKALA